MKIRIGDTRGIDLSEILAWELTPERDSLTLAFFGGWVTVHKSEVGEQAFTNLHGLLLSGTDLAAKMPNQQTW